MQESTEKVIQKTAIEKVLKKLKELSDIKNEISKFQGVIDKCAAEINNIKALTSQQDQDTISNLFTSNYSDSAEESNTNYYEGGRELAEHTIKKILPIINWNIQIVRDLNESLESKQKEINELNKLINDESGIGNKRNSGENEDNENIFPKKIKKENDNAFGNNINILFNTTTTRSASISKEIEKNITPSNLALPNNNKI